RRRSRTGASTPPSSALSSTASCASSLPSPVRVASYSLAAPTRFGRGGAAGSESAAAERRRAQAEPSPAAGRRPSGEVRIEARKVRCPSQAPPGCATARLGRCWRRARRRERRRQPAHADERARHGLRRRQPEAAALALAPALPQLRARGRRLPLHPLSGRPGVLAVLLRRGRRRGGAPCGTPPSDSRPDEKELGV